MANEQLSEQEIQFRKRARRRLIGAIALVLLMVTVLPMVLDDREDHSPQPEIAISIPSQSGGDFTSRIVPVAPQPAPSDTQPEAQVATPLEKPQPAKQPEVAPQNAQSAQVEPPRPAAAKPEKTEAPAASNAAEKPASGAGEFSVQIGVYSDAANVKKLQDKLVAQGFKSYTEKMDTANGAKIRLRVGPFATRVEAEKARDALKPSGMAGIVVAR